MAILIAKTKAKQKPKIELEHFCGRNETKTVWLMWQNTLFALITGLCWLYFGKYVTHWGWEEFPSPRMLSWHTESEGILVEGQMCRVDTIPILKNRLTTILARKLNAFDNMTLKNRTHQSRDTTNDFNNDGFRFKVVILFSWWKWFCLWTCSNQIDDWHFNQHQLWWIFRVFLNFIAD